ncbi:MAG: Gfo/Idh/MocA family oxidoreductase [Puniceicoccales bacterium]|nr:Gfo/Idh/MocA family oxidoreductase [Puniceicoccales bacterium]
MENNTHATQDNGRQPLNRRRFLATTTFAGAGLVLLSNEQSARLHAQSAGVPTNRASGNAINIAVVGCGAQGQILLDNIDAIVKEKAINLKLKALCDIWPYQLQSSVNRQKSRGFADFQGYRDIDEMLEKEKSLDAVFVATPDFLHAEHTNKSLKAGKHVYCEKMMANNIENARSMVRTMKETGKLLQIGHQRRSNPNYRYAYNVLLKQNKILGRIMNANAQWNRAVATDLTMPKKGALTPEELKRAGFENAHEFRNWRWFKKYSSGPISDLGAHQIDILNWVFGRPHSVIAAGGVDYYTTHEWYDNVMCIFDYKTPEGMARAYYQVLTTTSSGGGYFENFMGLEGSLKLSEQSQHIKVYAELASKDKFEALAAKKILLADTTPPAKAAKPSDGVADTRDTPPAAQFDLPSRTGAKMIHQFHVENFLKTVRGDPGVKLNCDGEHAFESEAPIFRVNEAVAAEKKLFYSDADFAV